MTPMARAKSAFKGLIAILLSPMAANADIILVNLGFDDPGWTGSASFDDTTGQAWGNDSSYIAYQITSMMITLSGVATWDESEIDAGLGPPIGGMLVDSVGRAALFVNATDTDTGLWFNSGVGYRPGLGLFTFSSLDVVGLPDAPRGIYIANVAVPEPGTLALIGIGLLGMGVARRRRAA